MNAATRATRPLVAAFAVLLALAGCSMDASTPPPSNASAPTATSTPAPPAPTAVIDVPVMKAGVDSQRPIAVPPVRLRIDSLDIDMTIGEAGLAESGSMELPPNPADAAWYRYGAWPGSGGGSIVIAAHVDSLEYGLGPLARLPQATPGTRIVVTVADGTELTYEVADEGMVIKGEVPWENVFDRAGESRLTLVTCGGEFDYDRLTYLSNVIVTALPTQ